ncbi:UbiD family decarboxylase [Curtobacterium sp. MCBD17_019]|uniref:UbiD family decarboxylase n=1 Tax=Curtobacterium sp. MCBD17_019 TaxID=2175669 RepID=UPI000DA9D301|nr:UbiD family decarboxylase [Curtobacterium sp. MCBD17_019]PZE76263.1 UbiD family decarboxylase [Curtobacterium sp. MCBD17_019]
MSRPDLRSWLATLGADELLEVDRRVRPGGEIAAVVKGLEPHGAPGVLFRDVEGSELPVLMGVFGKRSRVASALGVPVRQALDHVLAVQRGPVPDAVVVDDAPVHEVVVTGDDVDLGALPFAVHSRADAGRYITAGVVMVRDPATGSINTGMYRLMITGRNTITVNAAPDHDLGRVLAAAREDGRTVEIAVVIGHHPAYAIASQLKNPVTIDAHGLAGALLGDPLAVTPGRTVDLPIPADAELVLEAVVDPADRVDEGPFGEFSYHYGKAQAPVATITAVTRRADALFQDLHPTHAEHLCLWLFPGREARLLDAVRRAVPGTVDVRIPFRGGAFSAYIAVRKRRQGDGKQALLAAFAADHFLKTVVVVDDDIDVHDEPGVLWSVNVRFQADRDLMVLGDMKGIRMDPSAHQFTTERGSDALTAKLGFDTTRPLTGFPERSDLPPEGFEDLDALGYLDPSLRERITAAARVRQTVGE